LGQENTASEEFEIWLKTKFIKQVWIGGHNFKATRTSDIMIDGALFTESEAKLLCQKLTSKNPISQLNGALLIWERNGTLVKILFVIALLSLLVVFIIVRGE